MYAITGIMGKVGGALARALLADRRPVRAVVRDIEKGRFWAGKRVVELEGPKRVSPQEIGTIFAKILGCAVRVEAVPRKTWQALFESQEMLHPLPRIQMPDGFNKGWIDFESRQDSTIKGKVELQTVLQELVGRAG